MRSTVKHPLTIALMCLSIWALIAFAIHFYLPIFVHSEGVELDFSKGSSAASIPKRLVEKARVRCPICLSMYLKLFANHKNLQAGLYWLESSITPSQLIAKLESGQVWTQTFTITPGETTAEILRKASDSTQYRLNLSEAFQPVEHSALISCYGDIEGVFLSDSYQFQAGDGLLSVLQTAHQSLFKHLIEIWQERTKGLPYKTPCQLLTAASIIEKETGIEDERAKVSAVIVNRLRKNMRLQMDPTVIYALGSRYHYPLKRTDLLVQSPYNTYLNHGLPPGPIANVSLSALKAAAHPARSDDLYFVAKKNGRHHFSRTLKQQIEAINRYRSR